MRKFTPRVVRVTALTAAATFALLPMAAASAAPAATSNSTAYGASATLLNGTVIAPTPTSTFPPGTTSALIPVDLGALGSLNAVYANTAGDLTAGNSSADAGAANTALLGTTLARLITADAISAHCSETNGDPTTLSGHTTVTNLKVAGITVNVPLGSSPVSADIPGVATVTLNEQSTTNGVLTVNALHVTLLTGNLANIIVGHVTCGPNAAVLPVAAFSFQDMPVILAGIALLVAAGFGIRFGARRLRSAA